MEALKAARLFQSATGVYNAAKETVALAECSLIEETDTPTAHLSSAWQEMLSHAITKVPCTDPEGGQGFQSPSPLKNHKNIGFLSKSGPDPLYQASIQWQDRETPTNCRFAGDPMMASL